MSCDDCQSTVDSVGVDAQASYTAMCCSVTVGTYSDHTTAFHTHVPTSCPRYPQTGSHCTTLTCCHITITQCRLLATTNTPTRAAAWLDSGGPAARECDGNAERIHTFGERLGGVRASGWEEMRGRDSHGIGGGNNKKLWLALFCFMSGSAAKWLYHADVVMIKTLELGCVECCPDSHLA